jgi:large subunit ribosomal protein L22
MLTTARARFIRVSARKARLVLDQIRGKPVGEALATLEYTPRAAARLIEKVLRSAIANAEHNHQVRDLDDLRVVKATADGGPSMKRVSPRAMGRAFFIKHRTSHLTIGVSDEVNGGAMAPPMRRVTAPRRAAPPASAPAAKSEPPKGGRAPAKADAKAKASGTARASKGTDKKPARTPKSKEKA